MYRHFMDGCANDMGREKLQLRITLLDFFDTSGEKLEQSGHQPGPQYKCGECLKLLKTENKAWNFSRAFGPEHKR